MTTVPILCNPASIRVIRKAFNGFQESKKTFEELENSETRQRVTIKETDEPGKDGVQREPGKL